MPTISKRLTESFRSISRIERNIPLHELLAYLYDVTHCTHTYYLYTIHTWLYTASYKD